MVAVERKQQKCGGGGKACGDGKKGEGKVKKNVFVCSRGSQFALNNTICAPLINDSRSRTSPGVCSRSQRLFAVEVTRSSCKNI